MMELSFYNNGHKETYKNPLIDEILEVDLCKGAIVYSPVFGELWKRWTFSVFCEII